MAIQALNSLLKRNPLKTPKYSSDGPISFTFNNGLFEFHGHEIPETLEYYGGEQLLAVHNFPGGIRTVQTLGYFPAEINFSGWLFNFAGQANMVATVMDRALELKSYCDTNKYKSLTIQYGGLYLEGFVQSCHVSIINQNRARYAIHIIITKDLSDVANSQLEVTTEQALQKQMNKIKTVQLNPALPYDLSNPLGALSDGLQSYLLKFGTASAADVANLLSLSGNLSGATTSYITGSNSPTPELQSSALDCAAIASGVTTSLTATTTAVTTTLATINPNFLSLASQYFGDASLGSALATFNGLTDLQPIGQLNIKIPPVSALTGNGT